MRRLHALIADRLVAPAGHPQEPSFNLGDPFHAASCPQHFAAPAAVEFVSCSPAQIETALACAASSPSSPPHQQEKEDHHHHHHHHQPADSDSSKHCWFTGTTLAQRHEILKEAAAAIDKERKVYAALDAIETGIPLPVQFQIQEGHSPVALGSMEKAITDVLGKPLVVPSRFGGNILGQRRPVSPALIIAPWNVPIGTIIPKLFVALLCGCNVIVKPSQFAPSSITKMVETLHGVIFGKHGFHNVVQLIHGGGPIVGAQLVADRRVQSVQFTGAPKTAGLVAAQCAPLLKPLLAECGGSNALIVCHDADLTSAVRYCVMGTVTLNGQWCMGVSRVLIHKGLKAEFLERMRDYLARRIKVMASASDEEGLYCCCCNNHNNDDNNNNHHNTTTTMGEQSGTVSSEQSVFLELGPMSSEYHADSLRQAMKTLAASSSSSSSASSPCDKEFSTGTIETLFDISSVWKQKASSSSSPSTTENNSEACSCTTEPPPRSFLNPSVVLEPHPELAARTELFGPVFALNTFDDEADAIRMANFSPGMLACFVFSKNVKRAQNIGLKLNTGMSMVNSANFAFEPADASMEVECDFWGSAGSGTDGSGAAVANFFSRRTYSGVSGSQDHEGHE